MTRCRNSFSECLVVWLFSENHFLYVILHFSWAHISGISMHPQFIRWIHNGWDHERHWQCSLYNPSSNSAWTQSSRVLKLYEWLVIPRQQMWSVWFPWSWIICPFSGWSLHMANSIDRMMPLLPCSRIFFWNLPENICDNRAPGFSQTIFLPLLGIEDQVVGGIDKDGFYSSLANLFETTSQWTLFWRRIKKFYLQIAVQL